MLGDRITDFKVVKNDRVIKKYHFKVLKLTEGAERPPKIEELFNFEFGIHDEAPQTLHISEDCNRMMAVIQGRIANVYERRPCNSRKDLNAIDWHRITRVQDYPSLLLKGRCTGNYLFSPNFD